MDLVDSASKSDDAKTKVGEKICGVGEFDKSGGKLADGAELNKRSPEERWPDIGELLKQFPIGKPQDNDDPTRTRGKREATTDAVGKFISKIRPNDE